MSLCRHRWRFQGVVYKPLDPSPSADFVRLVYHDRYYCEKCLSVTDKNMRVEVKADTIPLPGTFPG